MKYIVDIPGGGWDFHKYFAYIGESESQLPRSVFEFAADHRNYDLTSHQSLHDAWLERLLILEPATGARSEIRGLEISCCFLGPFHDLRIHLRYIGVTAYSLVTPEVFRAPPAKSVGHGDLLVHEVTVEGDGSVSHEMLFSRGSALKISAASFTHELEMLT